MKKLLCLVLLLVFAVSFAACFNPEDDIEYTKLITRTPTAAAPIDYSDRQAVCDQVNKVLVPYAADFISAFLQNECGDGKNTLCSPLTAYFALSLAAEASCGKTQKEIISALHVGNIDNLRTCADMFYNAATMEYSAENQTIAKESVTNSLWLDPDFEYNAKTLDNLANYHHAFSVAASFKNDNEASNKAVNNFIYNESHKLLNPNFHADENTICLLISTLYVKDLWNWYNDLSFTQEIYNFVNYDGSTAAIKLLQSYYAEGKPLDTTDYQAFSATSSCRFKLHFVVPKEGKDIVQIMNAKTISNVLTYNYPKTNDNHTLEYKTKVLFPEFTAENSLSIKNTLQSLGVKSVFTHNADLSGLLHNSAAYFSDVMQANKLRVDKKGFEGASVTMSMIAGSAAPMPTEYFTVTVDRAFGFILTDPYGIPLFSGIIFNK